MTIQPRHELQITLAVHNTGTGAIW